MPSAFPLRLMGRALTARWDPQEGTVPSTLLGARSFPQAPGLSAPRAVRTKRSATHRPVGGILSQAKSVHAGSSGSKTVVFVVRSGLLLLDFPDLYVLFCATHVPLDHPGQCRSLMSEWSLIIISECWSKFTFSPFCHNGNWGERH